MAIDAKLIKLLREKTGMGISNCKNALEEAGGDVDKAEMILRKQGLDKAAKKADRPTGQGIVALRREGTTAALVELACEQEPTTGNERFLALLDLLLATALKLKVSSAEKLLQAASPEGVLADSVKSLIGVVGENVQLRRAVVIEAPAGGILGTYAHFNKKAAAIIALSLDGADAANPGLQTTANDIAMHAVAARPLALHREDIPADIIAKEKEVFLDEVKTKPENIREKIVQGKLQKFYAEKILTEQIFVKDPDGKATVANTLAAAAKAAGGKAEIVALARQELGL
ncbi:MAG: translation elongation factor Ts [Planctomycetota bacterium]|jgi:elongation factor Ts|nr:translation elongation factor Ts [Planctomycetota bacterium]